MRFYSRKTKKKYLTQKNVSHHIKEALVFHKKYDKKSNFIERNEK